MAKTPPTDTLIDQVRHSREGLSGGEKLGIAGQAVVLGALNTGAVLSMAHMVNTLSPASAAAARTAAKPAKPDLRVVAAAEAPIVSAVAAEASAKPALRALDGGRTIAADRALEEQAKSLAERRAGGWKALGEAAERGEAAVEETASKSGQVGRSAISQAWRGAKGAASSKTAANATAGGEWKKIASDVAGSLKTFAHERPALTATALGAATALTALEVAAAVRAAHRDRDMALATNYLALGRIGQSASGEERAKIADALLGGNSWQERVSAPASEGPARG